jgi:hypothetical protein
VRRAPKIIIKLYNNTKVLFCKILSHSHTLGKEKTLQNTLGKEKTLQKPTRSAASVEAELYGRKKTRRRRR